MRERFFLKINCVLLDMSLELAVDGTMGPVTSPLRRESRGANLGFRFDVLCRASSCVGVRRSCLAHHVQFWSLDSSPLGTPAVAPACTLSLPVCEQVLPQLQISPPFPPAPTPLHA